MCMCEPKCGGRRENEDVEEGREREEGGKRTWREGGGREKT